MQHSMPVNFVATPYGNIACREIGSGPVAVFLHGLPLSGREWREVMPPLAGLRRCIAIDQLGLGETEPVEDADLSYAGQADMLAACLDRLGVEQVDLVGNDTGGGIAQLFLARHGARLRSLTLTNCEVHDLWPNALLKGFYDGVADGSVLALLRAMLGDVALGQAHLGRLVYADPATLSAETIAACIANGPNTKWNGLLFLLLILLGIDQVAIRGLVTWIACTRPPPPLSAGHRAR